MCYTCLIVINERKNTLSNLNVYIHTFIIYILGIIFNYTQQKNDDDEQQI